MTPSRRLLAIAAILFVALAAIVVRLAWVSDDAYITLRTIENWFRGHGLRWNPAERVQTYTHPLWMLVLAGARGITGEGFFGTIAVGIGFTLGAVALLLRLGGTSAAAVAILACAAASRSFTTFGTSGLENPLTYVLLAAFVATATAEAPPLRRLSAMALLTALAALTRYDLAALCAPALVAAAAAAQPRWSAANRVLLGLAPLFAWIVFSVLYYGTPWPVTAYAKAIAPGIPQGELAVQGLRYLWYVTTEDPVTMAVIVAGTVVGLTQRDLRARPIAIGVALYCCYIVKVGGDFMGGRFTTPPFVAALAILAKQLACSSARVAAAVSAIALVLCFAPGVPPWLRPVANDEHDVGRMEYHGISDERILYYGAHGLLSSRRDDASPGVVSEVLRRQLSRTRPIVATHGAVGHFAWIAGDLVHVCDPWLCDPLLMRLPAHAESMRLPGREDPWHIGHFVRRIPEGYLESLATGQNRLHHPSLRRYYDALHTVLRAPVFDGQRLATSWRLSCGEFDDDLRAFVATDYTSPPRLPVALATVSAPRAAGTYWFDDEGVRVIYAGGLAIDVAPGTTATALRLMLHPGPVYRVQLRAGGATIASLPVDTTAMRPEAGLQPFELALPAGTAAFDAVWIDGPTDAYRIAALGGVQFVQ